MSDQEQNQSIKEFIKSSMEGDYAAANAHLTNTINEKLKKKIKEVYKANIFKKKS